MVLFALISSAEPGIPMVVNGTVYINGELAPPSTVVKAMMGGEVKGSSVVTEKGIYGVIVDYKPGYSTVDLYVNEIKSMSFEWSSDPKTANPRVTISGATPSSTATLQTDLQNKGIDNDSHGHSTVESPGFEIVIFVFAVLAACIARRENV